MSETASIKVRNKEESVSRRDTILLNKNKTKRNQQEKVKLKRIEIKKIGRVDQVASCSDADFSRPGGSRWLGDSGGFSLRIDPAGLVLFSPPPGPRSSTSLCHEDGAR